jgi:hypothetical protein
MSLCEWICSLLPNSCPQRLCTYLGSANAVVFELWAQVAANKSSHPVNTIGRTQIEHNRSNPNYKRRHPFEGPGCQSLIRIVGYSSLVWSLELTGLVIIIKAVYVPTPVAECDWLNRPGDRCCREVWAQGSKLTHTVCTIFYTAFPPRAKFNT